MPSPVQPNWSTMAHTRLSRRRPLPRAAYLPAAVGGLLVGVVGAGALGPSLWILLVMSLFLIPLGLLCHRRLGTAMAIVVVFGACGQARMVRQLAPESAVFADPIPTQRVRARVHGVVASVEEGAAPVRVALEVLDDGPGPRGLRRGEGVRLSLRHAEQRWELGDEIRLPLAVRPARGFCNGGRDGFARWLAGRGLQWTAWARDDGGWEVLGPEPGDGLEASLLRLRGRIGASIDRAVASPRAAGVVRALVIGDKGRLSPDLRAVFSRTGTAHLLAVSGMHLAIVAGTVFFGVKSMLAWTAGGRLGFPLSVLAAPLALLAAGAYATLSGAAVATLRALVMATLVLLGAASGRRTEPTRSVLAAVGLLVLWEPGNLADLSFQFSVASVIGILAALARLRSSRLGPWLEPGRQAGRARRMVSRILQGVLVSAAATVVTAPLTAHYFGMVSLIGVGANLLVGSWLGAGALGFGLAGVVAMPFPPLAHLGFRLAGWLVETGIRLLEPLSQLPGAALAVSRPAPWSTAGAVGLVCAAMLPAGRGRRAALGAALVVVVAGRLPTPAAGTLRIAMLDVGQGDAVLVETPRRELVLVDAGGLGGSFDPGERIVVPAIRARWGTFLETVVLSHGDRDHYGGLRAVVEELAPRQLWWNGRGSQAQGFRDLWAAVEARRMTHRRAHPGQVWGPGGGGPELRVLHPGPEDDRLSSNDASLVLALRYGATRLLLLGDVERRGERILQRKVRDLLATVVKVPHHGSRSSSSAGLVETARPALAVASLGAFNRYGFPAPEVVERYRSVGAHFLATDDLGEIVITSDGQLERVETCRSSPASSGHPSSWHLRLEVHAAVGQPGRRRSPEGPPPAGESLVARLDLAPEGDVAFIDADREAAFGVGADPRLEHHGGAFLPVIGERDQQPPVTLLALRQLHRPPPLGNPHPPRV